MVVTHSAPMAELVHPVVVVVHSAPTVDAVVHSAQTVVVAVYSATVVGVVHSADESEDNSPFQETPNSHMDPAQAGTCLKTKVEREEGGRNSIWVGKQVGVGG